MPEPSRVRIRTGLSWLLTLAVIAYALSQELAAPPALPQDDASDADGENDKLRVTDLKPLELSPGAALIVSVDGLTASEPVSVEIAKAPAPILRRSASQLVVRVPRNTAYGAAKLRVLSGSKRSKPRWLTLRPLPRDEMLRNCLGGMAIFLLGLGLVGRALRQYAGRRVRARLSLLTRGRVRPAALGALLGLTMQSTTSVAALLGGLCGARMLKAGAALVLLIGAQLGSAAAAVLFPLIATREALWILCIGVVWWSLAESRVSRALGNAMIGTGLLFHGLGLLQAGFAPLVSDPMLTPYFATFHSHELAGLLACVGAGAALTGLLQGPAAVFAVVMSLAQATGVLSLHDGLAILAGVNLGAVMNTYAATWPFGGEARRMANTHTLLAVVMSAVTVLGVPLWTRAADAIVAGNPGLAAYGAEVLLPRMGLHLGLGFVMSQLAAVLTALVLLPWALRRIDRRRGPARAGLLQERASQAPPQLGAALAGCRSALAAVREVTQSMDREASPLAEKALLDARDALHALLATEKNRELRAATGACVQLQAAIENALRIAEKASEHGYALGTTSASAHEHLHAIADAALGAIIESVSRGVAPSLEEAQAREIELNAVENETRRKLFEVADPNPDELPALLWSSELCAAYELVGNQLYRVASALGSSEL